jgi:tetratricopeptide (TPR) repeat protein
LLAVTPPLPAPYRAEAGAVQSQVALAKGSKAVALAHAETAEQVARGIGPRSSDLLLPLQAKGLALLALNRPREAEATFEEAVSLAQALQPWAPLLADAQVGLAKAKLALGQRGGAVASLLEAAKATYAVTPGAEARAKAVAGLLP